MTNDKMTNDEKTRRTPSVSDGSWTTKEWLIQRTAARAGQKERRAGRKNTRSCLSAIVYT